MKNHKIVIIHILASILISIFAFIMALINYYDSNVSYVFSRLFFENIFTTMFFCLTVIINYVTAELFTVIHDWVASKYKKVGHYIFIASILTIGIISSIIPYDVILQTNSLLLSIYLTIILLCKKQAN